MRFDYILADASHTPTNKFTEKFVSIVKKHHANTLFLASKIDIAGVSKIFARLSCTLPLNELKSHIDSSKFSLGKEGSMRCDQKHCSWLQ